MKSFDHVNDLVFSAVTDCLAKGKNVSPRDLGSMEICAQSFSLSNPRARLTSFENRNWSWPLAIGEFCWHLRGDRSLDALTYYAPSWKKFSDNGNTIEGSCYGYKAFDRSNPASQWAYCRDLLLNDPDSRRAVMIFDDINEINPFTRDKSCLTSIQFLQRDCKLNLIVNMRSNDIYLGLPYDIYLFTMIHELMALDLNCELGIYYHFVGSLHIYDKDIEKVNRNFSRPIAVDSMNAIPSLDELNSFLHYEEQIRLGRAVNFHHMNDYWKCQLDALVDHRSRKSEACSIAGTSVAALG
jgi:thymidylate synthase